MSAKMNSNVLLFYNKSSEDILHCSIHEQKTTESNEMKLNKSIKDTTCNKIAYP